MDRENNVFYWLPCSVVFVCTAHGETRDIMTATAMFVSEKEPLLAISVAKDHLTEKLIESIRKIHPGNRRLGPEEIWPCKWGVSKVRQRTSLKNFINPTGKNQQCPHSRRVGGLDGV